MTEETKEAISLNLELLKMTLQKTGTCLGFLYDKKDPQKSQIVIVDKENFIKGKVDGIKIDLEEMNGLKK